MPPVRLLASLKFRIVALAVSTGVMAAFGAAVVVVEVSQSKLQRQVLDSDRQDRERTAALLAGKLETLKDSLSAVARQARPELWRDAAAMTRFLLDKPALTALYDTVLAAVPEGSLLARIERGRPTVDLPNIADRAYFQQAMRSDQPVVSDALLGKVSKEALVIVAVPVLDSQGATRGVIGGTVQLRSNSLFADPVATREDAVRDLVIDRQGTVLWHTDTRRVLGRAADEPGLAEVLARWQASGRPIDTTASAELSQSHLVSMAGIPLSDWVLVRLTPQDHALAPMVAARRTAWLAALAAGLLSALLAGAVAWAAVRPIGQLRDAAERMLAGDEPPGADWPQQVGEVGAMSQAFQSLLQTRERQRAEMQALLQQRQAVLDYADVGLLLTRNGRFEMVSRQFGGLLGWEPSRLVGESTRVIHASPEAFQAFARRAEPAFLQHGFFDGEVELMRQDGQTFWARMRGRAVVPGDRSEGTIWVVADATHDKTQRERLSWAASHDRLTGLLNRAAFEVLLEEAAARAADEPFCALFIDLDRFKLVNDTGGHAAGDALLREISRELSARLRQSDSIARLGGDEFAVLLPQCEPAQAQVLAERLRAAVEQFRLAWEGRELGVGASIGLVAVSGTQANAVSVLREADAACYRAKHGGRNRVAVAQLEPAFDPGPIATNPGTEAAERA